MTDMRKRDERGRPFAFAFENPVAAFGSVVSGAATADQLDSIDDMGALLNEEEM
jgi:hypothetical protein